MNKTCIFIIAVLACLSCNPGDKHVEDSLNIIPQPNKVEINEGYFAINNDTKVEYKGLDKSVLKTINILQAYILKHTDINIDISDIQQTNNVIKIHIEPLETDNPEAYEITASTEILQIKASNSTGLFYAIQSIIQLLPNAMKNGNNSIEEVMIPAVDIVDYPEFSYRALNIDVARHFFPVEFIKKQLDLMALYKLNVLHWHLTDDQGWRIEIKKYPKLTSIGGTREKTLIGHAANIPLQYDNKKYSGFYTQNDIKEIVRYAQERHITIVPEIELPGHSLAALAAYPQLGCTGGPYKVAVRWGGFDDTICPGKESSYSIIRDILTEVAHLFPGEYIHIGGDQCSRIRWRDCEHCQKRIKELALGSEKQLEHYFINQVQNIVNNLGKKIVGWDEIISNKTLNNVTIIRCQEDIDYKHAANNNIKIVQSPNNYLYFDHYQSDPKNHPLAIGGYTPLREVYEYAPIPDELNAQERNCIIGTQANCWSEYLTSNEQFEYMLYPRMLALSEMSWSNEKNKDWPSFMGKLDVHQEQLDILGVNYHYEVPKPVIDMKQLSFVKQTTLRFKNISDKYETRLTTNGSEPDINSKLYQNAISVKSSGTVKAITINKKTKAISNTAIFNLNQLQLEKPIKANLNAKGLKYTIHRGRFKTIKEIQNISTSASGIATQAFIPDSIYRESFGIVLNGYFKSDTKGIYEFAIDSDDGSALYINNELVVNNDGIHGKKVEKGAIALDKGIYAIKIYYFQTSGNQHLNITVTKPENNSISLKPTDFHH